MIRYKKIIITLVALLAVTGAWAEETPLVTITFDSNGPVYSVEGLVTLTGTNYALGSSSGVYFWSPSSPTKTLSATVEAVADNVSISKVVFWGLVTDYDYPLEDTEKPFVCYSNADKGGRSLSETDWTNIKSSERIAKIDVYAASSGTAVEVAWNKASKTGTFTMPGGNVTLEPEYYPQAALAAAPTAINDVPATTDGAIVKAGTVANIVSTTTAQGTVMYYVSPTALDDAALLALAADAWTADVPTAESLAAGQAYVYYYVRGNDSDTDDENFSDGDILAANGFEVTLAAAPTYKVEFAEGTPETDKWKADPNPAKKGETVTATYSGSRKVKSVKAVKKVNPNAYLKWDADQKKLVEAEIPATATTVANADAGVTWTEGTYVVEGNVTINGKIYLTGNVDLIIKDGAKLTATRINSPSNDKKNLSIYGQSKMNGELVINTTSLYAIDYLSTLAVHSCKVTAYSTSSGGIFAVNTINVYGGLLDAKYTGSDGYGIFLSGGGKMNIYGGEVKAASNGTGVNSYGIMASTYDSAITVTVYGGKLWAESPGNTVFNTAKTTFAKGDGFTGKIETSSDGSSWTEYTSTGTPDAKYVRVGY